MTDLAGGQIPAMMVDLAAGQPVSDKAAAALHASADGRFLYVSNRGTANQMLVFAIDPASGHLKELQRRSVEGDHPREFSLDPSGKLLADLGALRDGLPFVRS